MSDGEPIPIDKIETVCTECFRIIPKRAPATCPTCGGRVTYVALGQGAFTVQQIKARGHGPIEI
jgi:rRNA maturation endonuclease Nob1